MWSCGLGLGIFVFNSCIYDGRNVTQCFLTFLVDGGKRAVIFDRIRGVLPKTIGEGTHFRIPFIQVSICSYADL